MIQTCNEVSERSGGRDQSRSRVYTRDFQIITDDPTDGSATILDFIQNNIATWGDTYEEIDQLDVQSYVDADSVLVDMKARQNDKNDLQNWFVTLYYAGYDDPTQQPADIDSGEIRWQEAMIEDKNGNPCVNSAGDPLEDGVMRDRTKNSITIIKNQFTWDPIQADQFRDSLNANLFLSNLFFPGFAPGTCKLTSLTAKRIQRTNQQTFYWARRAVVDIDSNGWNAMVRDAGFRAIGTDGKLREIIFDNGTRPSTPVLLDGTGKQLVAGQPPVIFPPGGFVKYSQMDWTVLNLEDI